MQDPAMTPAPMVHIEEDVVTELNEDMDDHMDV